MGFGILLIGYFIAFGMSLSSAYFFADVIGLAVMSYGAWRLSVVDKAFFRGSVMSAIGAAVSLAAAIGGISGVSGFVPVFLSALRIAVILLIHVTVLVPLRDMAGRAEDGRLAGRADRNLKIMVVYYALFAIKTVISPVLDNVLFGYFSLMIYLFGIVTVVMNLLLLHSAYARLYIEGGEPKGEAEKKSRIPILNRIRSGFNASQKKAFDENYKMMRESVEYAAEHADEREKKKNKRKRGK